MGAKKRASFTVRAGSVELPIYHRTVSKSGGLYDEWTLVFYDTDGKRVRKFFSDRTKAEQEGERIAMAMSRGQSEAVRMTAADCDIYNRAMMLVKPAGVSLLGAVTEWSDARAKLPVGSTLSEAVTDYAKRHPSGAPKKTVPEVVDEMLANLRARRRSEEHQRDLRMRLGRFSSAFTGPIASVVPADIAAWVLGLESDGEPISNRSRFNYQRAVVALFLFARQQRYIGKELAEEITDLPAPEPETPKTEIFRPEEMVRILNACPEDILPALAIGAFSGLRTKELHKLSWESVKVHQGVIVVEADNAKTRSRRTVPITENLAQWLAPYAGRAGRVSPSPTDRAMNHRFARIAAKVGVTWKHNALRHSFCTYRIMLTRSAAQTAMEAGNSESMIYRHYREIVSESEARAWFDIRPNAHADIIPMPSAVIA